VNRQVQSRLREHFSEPMLAEPVRTKPLEDALDQDDLKRELRQRRAAPM
jgi:hypothetical protein